MAVLKQMVRKRMIENRLIFFLTWKHMGLNEKYTELKAEKAEDFLALSPV